MPAISRTTPGVYIEEDASLAFSVNNSATAVPVFIGEFTPKSVDTTTVCTRINNWLEFTSAYSLAPATEVVIKSTESVLLTADSETVPKSRAKSKSKVADVTENKWEYRIEDVKFSPAVEALQLYFQNGGGACYIYPIKNADDALAMAAIPDVIEQKGDITLLVCPESKITYKTIVYNALKTLLSQKVGYFLIADSNDGDSVANVSQIPQAAVYYPQLETNLRPSVLPDDENIIVSGYENEEGKDQFKTLAALREENPTLAGDIDDKMQLEQQRMVIIPPSAVIAGVYCQTDSSRGVWKAPANVVLNGIGGLLDKVDDQRQGDMNARGINVIRFFSGRGFVVWGARTSVGDSGDINWRYIPVRRLFSSAERDIRQALRSALFETNNQPTWIRAKAAVDNYLYALWQRGALMGDRPEEAYFVQIGQGLTMSDDDIKQGKMIMTIGLAAVRPAEFIILQFTQDVAQ
ncbi:phage tail sheath family protein [Yersinia similis]|uniref:Phage tail sheath protein n=1 Tax=Yersinia similis TaxID=367190 RepID=A0A0T9QV89_9GAMM|nr:phage tail sheath subtilisin-like domain-containing protein [Yersinia similis]CNC08809.1 Phage tail sheath protein [Yersinia similis]CNF56488.1 Phage tail sheath protein [Yersinia similis]CNI30278.1 Phage tail sheath protein [Yersinia similis]